MLSLGLSMALCWYLVFIVKTVAVRVIIVVVHLHAKGCVFLSPDQNHFIKVHQGTQMSGLSFLTLF
jgi:hypothetical protein